MSSYVYGNPKYLPIDEKHPVASANPYMGSKITGEEICRQLSHLLKFPLIILRVFNIYGDFEIPGRLISDLLQNLRQGNSLVLNDPVPKRDYLYIKDLEVSLRFYEKILGWERIRSDTLPFNAAALPSGRTHHALLLIEVGDAPKRYVVVANTF